MLLINILYLYWYYDDTNYHHYFYIYTTIYYLKLPWKYFSIFGMIEKKNDIFLDRKGLYKVPSSFWRKHTQINLVITDIIPKIKPLFVVFLIKKIFQLELTFHIILVSGVQHNGTLYTLWSDPLISLVHTVRPFFLSLFLAL